MYKNLILLLACIAASTTNVNVNVNAAQPPAEIKLGEPHSTVQTLNADTFRPALNDPANGLWLLKFYAPWCGHCKHLAPKLDAMAAYLSGKIAIGKVDCTSPDAREICEEFKVRGYPTIKVYRDGDFFDYSGKRDADSMIEFAERMSKPAVKIVEGYDEFMGEVLKGKNEEEDKAESLMPTPGGANGGGSSTGVAFLVFDVKGKEMDMTQHDNTATERSSEELTTVEKYMASTTALQVFGQASRKMQDQAVFGMLHPSKGSELKKFGIAVADAGEGQGYGNDPGPLLVKIEENVDPVIYDGPLTTMDFMDFVKANNIALVTDLSGKNFRNVAYLGKELFIGAVNPDSEKEVNDAFLSSMRSVAKAHAASDADEYIFCQMDGKKWSNFLSQFNIETESMPQYLVLDVPTRKYYQNETITDIREFVEGVNDGTIAQLEQSNDGGGGGGILESLHGFMSRNMPYTLVGVVVVFCGILYCALAEDPEEALYQSEMLKLQLERAKKENMKKKAEKEDWCMKWYDKNKKKNTHRIAKKNAKRTDLVTMQWLV